MECLRGSGRVELEGYFFEYYGVGVMECVFCWFFCGGVFGREGGCGKNWLGLNRGMWLGKICEFWVGRGLCKWGKCFGMVGLFVVRWLGVG